MKKELTITKSPEASAVGQLLITAPEGARRAGVSERTFQSWAYSKKIPSIKIGRTRRFRWADVEKALERFTVKAIA